MIFPWMRLLLSFRQLKLDSDSAAPTMPRLSGPTSAVDPLSSITIIEPRPGWRPIQLAEIWQYRDLLFFLAWRDIQVRYKQTVLGGAWAVIQPLMTMIVLAIAFGKLGKMAEHTEVPYPVLTFCGAVPWTLFAASLSQAGNSLIGSQNLISKVYFPRLIIPVSSILGALLDFAIAFGVLLVLMFIYGLALHWSILLLPVFVLLTLLTALAVGLCLSALNVEYRDVRYTFPFLTQLWLLASPVGYSSKEIPPAWQMLYGLNPMTGVIEGFRWALLGMSPPSMRMMMLSAMIVVALLVGGLYYFRRVEKTFADII
jgi:homopolymeric O-antigen transport system permease protein